MHGLKEMAVEIGWVVLALGVFAQVWWWIGSVPAPVPLVACPAMAWGSWRVAGKAYTG